jgi:hypothetical protein
MNTIFVLQTKPIDVNFGEHKDEWQIAGWTDDFAIARKFLDGSSMDERRDYEVVERVRS